MDISLSAQMDWQMSQSMMLVVHLFVDLLSQCIIPNVLHMIYDAF
jgi:hypothetical protein